MSKLSFYRKRRGLTQLEVGKALGVSKQLISAWENNAANIDPKHFDKLKTILQIDESMMLSIVSDNAFSQKISEDNELREIRAARISNVRPPSGDGCFVPIITSAAAATCNPGLTPLMDCVNQNSEDKTWFKQAKDGDFVIEVTGTSMSPWYPDGTLLLVRPYQELKNGQRVVAVLDSGEIIFKIYAEKGNKICLFSIDHGGKDFIFTKPLVPLRYICRVIASQRNEDDLDEEMRHVNISHDWQKKLNEL